MPGSEQLLNAALSRMRMGQNDQAIDLLRRLLSDDPENPAAHALLGLCLLDGKRVHAARHEADMALRLDPALPLAHYAATLGAIADRNFKKAEEHLAVFLDMEPGEPQGHRLRAQLLELQGRRDAVLPVLEQALELDPEDARTLTAIGNHYLGRGEIDKAEEKAAEVLRTYPEDHEALTLMGFIHLRRGEEKEAREHAIWALRQNPADPKALHLISAIKARANRFLGLWWRYHTKMSELGETRAIMVLLAAFVIYRAAAIFAHQQDYPAVAALFQWVWLGLCVYTWVGPGIFRRSLEKELGAVRLDDDF